MLELDPENVVAYLRQTGRIAPGLDARAEPLAGGVSNVVLRIRVAGGPGFVIKQARERLRTRAEWRSRLDRIWREADLMRTLARVAPTDFVPRVLFEDRPNYLFAMEAVPDGHVVWKEQLLAGCCDDEVALRLGEALAMIHQQTADDGELRERFGDRGIFEELRVTPFYRRIAEVHPRLRPAIERLIDELLSIEACLVHADYSPKNVLILRRSSGLPESEVEPEDNGRAEPRITLVDYETGHYGDPAFDTGFLISHLLLKAVRRPDQVEDFTRLARTFWNHYNLWGLGEKPGPAMFRDPDLARRTLLHLGACLLSRIDGTSPVDYLPDPAQHAVVRGYCRDLLLDTPPRVFDALDRLEDELKR